MHRRYETGRNSATCRVTGIALTQDEDNKELGTDFRSESEEMREIRQKMMHS